MRVPKGMTEEEVLAVIDNVARRLASRFRFGYHGIEDMQQQARLFCVQGIEKYKPGTHPLENFLWTHARNRLFNYKRDNYMRLDKPCLDCPLKAYDPHCAKSNSQCVEFDDKQDCELYASWSKRTEAKHNVMYPVEISSIDDSEEKNMKIDGKPIENMIDDEEIFRVIDRDLDIELRPYYIKMKNGGRVPKVWRLKVNARILEILSNAGIKSE